ncbi:MAG: threonine synthase [Candidatus Woesearchaeota archaeon]
MKYINSRGGLEPIEFSDTVLWGLGPRNGLLLPESFPKYSRKELLEMSQLDYKQLAFHIMKDFIDDIPDDDLKKIIDDTYNTQNFDSNDITPLIQFDSDLYLLDLYEGPTRAFKDVALQFLGRTFDYILTKIDSTTNILTATSGDTGSAAIYGIAGRPRLNITVLTPKGKMSAFQTAQMYSVLEDNVHCIAVDGNFDDCQWMMEQVNEDVEFREKYRLGSMNSKNWARILAQIVYYGFSVLQVNKNPERNIDDEVDVVVPTGNFGNILAGYYARKIGFPIGNLILATNENNVLDEFFKTGIYRPRTDDNVFATNSPSMDIAKASNFERYIYDIIGDPEKNYELWVQASKNGFLDLSHNEYFNRVTDSRITSGMTFSSNRAEVIKRLHKDYGLIIDTHTANGVYVGLKEKRENVPMVFLATADPCKFEDTMKEILGNVEVKSPDKYLDLETREQRYVEMKKDVPALKEYIRNNSI